MKKDIGMAMSVAKKNKKKSPPSAKSEARPMPGEINDSGKPAKNDHVLDQPTLAQARKASKTPLSRPRIANSGVFSVNDVDPMSDMKPGSPKAQPPMKMDEKGPARKGPGVPALKMKRMAQGGMMPMGSEDDMAEHPEGLESDNDQIRPPSEEYMKGMMAGMHHAMANGGNVEAEEDYTNKPDKGHGAIIFKADGGDVEEPMSLDDAAMEAQHDEDEAKKDHKKMMAEDDHMMADGGEVDLDGPEDDKRSSIAAAIMAKRQKMAEGGRVDLEANAEEGPGDIDDINEDAAMKENYSDSDGLRKMDSPEDSNEMGDEREDDEEDKHDMVGSIRRRMNMRRQFKD